MHKILSLPAISTPYYRPFERHFPKPQADMSDRLSALWRFCAGLSMGLSIWYLTWRWSVSLNPDAMMFSIIIATAETCCVIGMALFYYDIWAEPERRVVAAPDAVKVGGSSVDIFITTFDEDPHIVEDSLIDATKIHAPKGWSVTVHLLDDGARADMRHIAACHGVQYHARTDNVGFKAGNLKHAMLRSDGDFIVIGDADTRFFPTLLQNTLGYFKDPSVAWVQTPHCFYDIPPVCPTTSWWQRWFRTGVDPFLMDPTIFFDVIQRRRDRHGASFCCGAGSVHRRAAICEHAMTNFAKTPAAPTSTSLQPFKFHVSEDLFTSIQLHAADRTWTSVYHPDPECRMLSPWSVEAWASQKLKYAGGTFDIFLNRISLWRSPMDWRIKLHYFATFWSYLAVFPTLVLFFAPIVTTLTGIAPIASYSTEFFAHLLPMVLGVELALMFGCKGNDVQSARIVSIATVPYVLKAFWQSLCRRRIGFTPTPKTLKKQSEFRFLRWQIAMMCLQVFGLCVALFKYGTGVPGFSSSLMIVNGFWMVWNIWTVWQVVRLGGWTPPVLPERTRVV
ncbi:MAG: glycosyltransferase [Planktomarina sp.]